MRKEAFAEVLGDIDARYIAEARQTRRKPVWRKWGAAAACLCLMAGLAAAIGGVQPAETPKDAAELTGGPPALTVNGATYLISPYLSSEQDLPEGFDYAGEIRIGDDVCPYYTAPDTPEWVYVYQEVLTDGTVDETGTLNRCEPHPAYVRYVDSRLRGRDLICRNGAYYISMWSAECYGSDPDVSRERYDELEARYGVRIEGAVPDGFAYAGSAVFTGKDTIPTGQLASNTGEVAVYDAPADPDVLLVETDWVTAPAAGSHETRHEGFNVYLRYDGPFAADGETR